jgi:hypothetical protein
MREIPWAGLAALVAMFVIPFLPAWLFEGPRTVRHRPARHVCAECGAPWTAAHLCAVEPVPELGMGMPAPELGVPAPEYGVANPELGVAAPGQRVVVAPGEPLRGELRRLRPPRAELERRRRIA